MTDSELILARISEIKTIGHGSVTVKIRDGVVQEIDTTKQERVK